MDKALRHCCEHQALLDCVPGGIMKHLQDELLTMIEVNQGFLDMFGFTLEEISERFHDHFVEMIHPSDYIYIQKDMIGFLESGSSRTLCFRVLCSDGSYKEVMENLMLIRDEKEWYSCVFIDISATTFAAEELRQSPERFQFIMEQTTDVIFEWDMAKDTMIYSPNWLKKFGYKTVCTHFTHKIEKTYIHADDVKIVTELIDEIKAENSIYNTAEFRLRISDGTYNWCRVRSAKQYDETGRLVKAVGVISDIDEEKKKIENLRRRAERDALTGLYNREETERQVREYLELAPNELCALFMIDTDNFKQVNDTQGHLFGDAVLTEIAAGMKRLTRQTDVVGRIGGDEFAIFLKQIPSRAMVKNKAAGLIDMFQHLFEKEKHTTKVTCSVGIAVYPEDGLDFQSLYRSADIALYEAKSKGKNQYVIYDQRNAVPVAETGYSTLGTAIDSNLQTSGAPENLASYVFKMLYESVNLDESIRLILEIVGKRFDVSRTYVFENSEDGKYCDNTYEWCNSGINPQKEYLQHFSYEGVNGYQELFTENSLFYCRDIHTLKPELTALFESQGIRSTLQCAIREDGVFRGFVGFDECTGTRMWTKEEVGMLTLISQLLSTFLLKKRVTERDRQIAVQLNTILDMQDAYIYAIGQESYELFYLNSKTRKLDSSVKPGMTCHKAFYDREVPCEKCPLNGGGGEFYNPRYHVWTKVQVAPMKWGCEDAYLISCFDITQYKDPQNC